MNHTTLTFSRHARQSGTEYANSIYRTRTNRWSEVLICIGMAAVMASPYLFFAWKTL